MGNVLARCNGVELVDRDEELWIVQRRSPLGFFVLHFATWMLGLAAAILLINGATQAAGAAGAARWASVGAAVVMLAVGIAIACGLVALRRRAARRAATCDAGPDFILAGGRLLDGDRRDLADLGDVRCRKVWQLASSSCALALEWPTGSAIIARGYPLADSVHTCASVLRDRGILGSRERTRLPRATVRK